LSRQRAYVPSCTALAAVALTRSRFDKLFCRIAVALQRRRIVSTRRARNPACAELALLACCALFSTRENKSMTPEEFMAPGAEPDRIDGDLSSVWVETRWGLAAVIIAACLVALGAFYYVVACLRIN
jgi:hypothetical protein